MMQAIGQFALSGPFHAMLVVAGFAVVALILPPISILSGAAIALVALREGLKQALIVAVGAAVLLALSALLMQLPATIGVVYGLGQWAPVIGLAWLLRQTISWSLTLQVALAFGLLGVLWVHVQVPDTAAFWQAKLEQLLRPMIEQSGSAAPGMLEGLASVSQYLTGVLFASLVLSSVLTLMLARSIQARLFNPGGFRQEFNELRVGRWVAVPALAVIAAAIVVSDPLPRDLALVLVAGYFLQGLAVVHGLGAQFNWPRGWMFGMYVLLVLFLWPLAMLFAGLGLVDAFANFRERARSAE